jgi:hypothetical protein
MQCKAEARRNFAKAVENKHVEQEETGLSSQISALFEGAGLDEPIAEWRGEEAEAAVFGRDSAGPCWTSATPPSA